MREEKAEGVEEEIVLQQINITVEKVKKEETVKNEEKAKRKEKTQESKGKSDKIILCLIYLIAFIWKAEHLHLDCTQNVFLS